MGTLLPAAAAPVHWWVWYGGACMKQSRAETLCPRSNTPFARSWRLVASKEAEAQKAPQNESQNLGTQCRLPWVNLTQFAIAAWQDVTLAECMWKWGHVPVTTYIDVEQEAIHSEAFQTLTLSCTLSWGDPPPPEHIKVPLVSVVSVGPACPKNPEKG
eukprot:6032423-Amphidinium_carterae.1